jgi:hypothetical protein
MKPYLFPFPFLGSLCLTLFLLHSTSLIAQDHHCGVDMPNTTVDVINAALPKASGIDVQQWIERNPHLSEEADRSGNTIHQIPVVFHIIFLLCFISYTTVKTLVLHKTQVTVL